MSPKTKSRSHRTKQKSLVTLQPARLDGAKFRQLYASLLRCRMLLEKLKVLEEQGSLEQAALLQAGHEAIATGLLIDLLPDDVVAPGLHSATARLLRGEPVRSIIGEMLADVNASAGPKANQVLQSRIPSCLTLAGQINFATGAAWAFKTLGDTHVAINFCDDGIVALDFWNEAVQFSVLNKLPIVYVVHSFAEGAANGSLLSNLAPHPSWSLPVLVVDGNDAVAIYRVGQEAVRRARQGRGPSVIHCETNGWLGSSVLASDSPQVSQTSTDPVCRLEMYLRQRGHWSQKWRHSLVSSFARELVQAVQRAEKTHLRILRSGGSAKSVLASVG